MAKVEAEVKPNIDIEQAAYDAVELLVKEAKVRYNESLQPLIDLAIECEAPVINGNLKERASKSVIHREILHNFLWAEVGPQIEVFAKEMGACGRAAKEVKEAHHKTVKDFISIARDEAAFALAKVEGTDFVRAASQFQRLFTTYKMHPAMALFVQARELESKIDGKQKAIYAFVVDLRSKHERLKKESPVASSALLGKMKITVKD